MMAKAGVAAAGSVQTIVPYASIAAAYDNTGISNDNAPAAGAFDGGGLNFSAQALAADGFVSGQTVTLTGDHVYSHIAGKQVNYC
jgi:beta-glucosidase